MKKILSIGFISILIIGCAPMQYDVSSSTTTVTNLPSSTVYYYDEQYDYYDGMYGNYVGGVYYVYRSNGNRYVAPAPRYSRHPRFSQKGWDGFRPGDRFHVPPNYYPHNTRPNYNPNRPNNRPDLDRPHYNPNKPSFRPPVTSHPSGGIGRPEYNNNWNKPVAKPVNPILHEQKPIPHAEWSEIEKNNRPDKNNGRNNEHRGNR